MSFLVTRPPVPVPGTTVASIPCSAAIRATTGETKVFPLPVAAGAAAGGAACATGAAAGAGAAGGGALSISTGSGAGAAGVAPGVASAATSAGSAAADGCGSGSGVTGSDTGAPTSVPGAAMRARTVPTSTVSPSWTRISATTPSAALGTSVSTLSVEISSSGSSRPIGSPTWRSHFVTVPSETETPIWGITTSVCVPVDTVPPVTSRRRALSAHSRRRRPAG